MKQDIGHGEHKSDSKNHGATGKYGAHGKNGRNTRHERAANPSRHSSRTSGNHDKDIRIVYEDQWLIVIEKPSGLLTISAGREGEDTAYSILTDYVREAKPMGRRGGNQRMRWDTWSDGRRRMERPRRSQDRPQHFRPARIRQKPADKGCLAGKLERNRHGEKICGSR